MLKKILFLLVALLQSFACFAFAETISVSASTPCSTSSVVLTEMYAFGSTTDLISSDIESSQCIGLFSGNDKPLPQDNLGDFEDGFLNGEDPKNNPAQLDGGDYYFTGFEFLDENDPVKDLNGDGEVDPGWIYLGSVGVSENSFNDPTYSFLGGEDGLNLSEVLTIEVSFNEGSTTSGTWSLILNENILDLVEEYLGYNYFDHLSIVLKTSNYFGVYDFDFNDIFSELTGDVAFVPYEILSGTFSTADFTNENDVVQSLSHISFWARDPYTGLAVVPEPATLVLLGIGMVGVGFYARKRH